MLDLKSKVDRGIAVQNLRAEMSRRFKIERLEATRLDVDEVQQLILTAQSMCKKAGLTLRVASGMLSISDDRMDLHVRRIGD